MEIMMKSGVLKRQKMAHTLFAVSQAEMVIDAQQSTGMCASCEPLTPPGEPAMAGQQDGPEPTIKELHFRFSQLVLQYML